MALNIFHFYPHQYSLITLISFLAFEYTKLLPFGGFALAVSLSKTLLFSLRSQPPPQFKSFLFHLGHPPYTSLFYFTQSTHSHSDMITIVDSFGHCLLLPLEYKNMSTVATVVFPAPRRVAGTQYVRSMNGISE